MKTIFFALFLLISVFGLSIFGQTKAKLEKTTKIEKTTGTQFFPVSELKEGMKGTAWTVFRGSEPEEFTVEILGVVPGAIGPKQDMIIGRLSGGSADRTSVFAGMSGSPVYIDGKLVGAISYSFPFSKEPICGITPIEQMLAIFEQNQNQKLKPKEPRAVSFAELASTTWKPNFPKNAMVSSSILASSSANSPLTAVAGQSFQPIATPLSFSGFSQETLNLFAPQLASVGLLPVAGVGGAARITPLKEANDKTLLGGTSVSMQLVRGDYSLAASGTVTFRDGEKIYAFGHPFLNLGTSDLPMSESHVVTVIPNLNNSFKLAVPDALVGSMTQDRATGVYGSLGKSPKMIPVKLNLETSRNNQETLNFEVVKDDFLTPILLNIAVYNSIVANERGLGDSTVEIKGEIKIKNQEPIKIERRFAGAQASQFTAISVAAPVNALLQSRFDGAEISEINLNVTSIDGSNTATLERIALDRTEVKAGESFEVQAFVRTEAGKVFSQKIPVRIPADTPGGTLMITVGDGGSIQQNAASKQFVPKDLSELIRTINQLKKADRLYVQTYRVTNGAIIGANEMPNLPPSMLATLNNDRTAGGFKPTVLTVLTDQELPPADFLISGQQVLTIEVVK
ncbi:MAG: SpoIVB peptidase S55 domain-containing protein [Pyrinomonadaceae bacterium]